MYSTLNEYGRPGRRYQGPGERKVYTGLQYKDVYVGIISSVEEETKRKADEEEEAQKAFEKDQRINNAIDSTEPDSKDEQRAKDAARRAEYQCHTNKRISFMPAFYRLWQIQDAKITDEAKRKRRVIAFYNEAQKHEMSSTDDIRWRNDIYHVFKN